MQCTFAHVQLVYHFHAGHIDHLYPLVIGVGVIYPYLATIGARHDEDRLAGDIDAGLLCPVLPINHQHLMVAHCGQEGIVVGHRPAFQVRHLVYRQALLSPAVVGQYALYTFLRLPQVQFGQPVLTEQAGHVGAAVGGDKSVVGHAANIFKAGDDGCRGIRQVQYPDLVGVEQAVDELIARSIHQPHGFGWGVAACGGGGNFGHQAQVAAGKHLDATGLVVGNSHHAAILGDRTTDGVTSLHNPFADSATEQIEFGQAAIASEDKGVARVPGVDSRGVRQVSQALNSVQYGVVGVLNDQDTARGPLNHDAHIARAADVGLAR